MPSTDQTLRLGLAALLLFAVAAWFANGHPQCTDFRPPFQPTRPLLHCPQYTDSACCTGEQDAKLGQEFDRFLASWSSSERTDDHQADSSGDAGSRTADSVPRANRELNERCRLYLRSLQCLACSPFAAHAYDVEATGEELDDTRGRVPALCYGMCRDLVNECGLPVLRRFFNLGEEDDSAQDASSNHSRTTTTSRRNGDARAGPLFCSKWSLNDKTYCYPNINYTERGQLPPDVTDERGNSPSGQARAGDDDSDCLCVEEVASDLVNPLTFTSSKDGTGRMFIGEQKGIIKVMTKTGKVLSEPYLDITRSVGTHNGRGDERGLLGLEFHPNFRWNSKFYTYYSHYTRSGKHYSRVSQWTQSRDDANLANHSSERIVLQFTQPQSNHNGGQVTFGPDGYLYVFSGDGGGAGDKHGENGNAQDMSNLLGKVLRIDVNVNHPQALYAVPYDNPFTGLANTRSEIYAYGLRNPWRCSFDRGNALTGSGAGRLFCGDVGQRKREEIDLIVKGGNYGWRGLEGNLCYDKKLCKQLRETSVLPIHDYGRDIGRSVTGGYVYRGCQWPNMEGRYFYGDYSSGKLFSLTEDPQSPTGWVNKEVCLGSSKTCTNRMTGQLPRAILSFGEDEQGEIYILAVPSHRAEPVGKIFRLVDPRRRSDPSTCQESELRKQVVTTTPPPLAPTVPPQARTLPPTPQQVIATTTTPPPVTLGAEDARKCETCLSHQGLHWELRLGEICTRNHTHYFKARIVFQDNNFGREGLLLVKILEWFGSRPHGLNSSDERPSNVFVWVLKEAAVCGCMEFTVGETYLIMARSRHNTFLLDFETIKINWQPITGVLMQAYLAIKNRFCS
eukprot:scpid19666/ scgid30222/ HHIP-like protein 1